jgi:hypothetical protein
MGRKAPRKLIPANRTVYQTRKHSTEGKMYFNLGDPSHTTVLAPIGTDIEELKKKYLVKRW